MSNNDLPLDVLDTLAESVLDGGQITENNAPAVPINDEKGNLQALAMRLWLYEAGRDIAVTQQLLHERTDMIVSLSQLRAWRDAGSWGEIFHDIHQKVVNDSRLSVSGMSTLATVKAVRTLVELMDGKHGATAATMLKAAMSVLDRFGYPTLMRGEMLNSINPGASDSFRDMSDADLEAEWSAFSADGEAIEPEPQDERMTRIMNERQLHASVTAFPAR